VPPVADIALEYAVFAVPAGSEAEIVNAGGAGAAMTSERLLTDLVCAGLDESVTVKLRLVVLLAAGVPEMTPVVVAKVRPVGRVPAMDQL
jgi:hypothetical protein